MAKDLTGVRRLFRRGGITLGIVWGLVAALFWGVADFLARQGSRAIGSYRTLWYMQWVGLAGLSAYLLISGELQASLGASQRSAWAWAALAALINTASTLALYRAFEVGVLAIVSPIAASYGAITALLAIMGGEEVSALRVAGIAIAVVGIVLAAREAPAPGSQRSGRLLRHLLGDGIGLAIGAALGFGFAFWVLGSMATPRLGPVAPVWLLRLTAVLLLLILARPLDQGIARPPGKVWPTIAAIGVLDAAAYVAYGIGVGSEQVAVVTILAALFSAVTVLLAWLVLRERLRWWQWLGVALIMVSIGLVSV